MGIEKEKGGKFRESEESVSTSLTKDSQDTDYKHSLNILMTLRAMCVFYCK